MKYTTFACALLLTACQAKQPATEAPAAPAIEDDEAAAPTGADEAKEEAEAKAEQKAITQTSMVALYETARCTRMFDCFPEGMATEALNFKDVEECVQNRAADWYPRRDVEGKALFCRSGSSFRPKQAAKCLDWLENMHCGVFLQIYLSEDPFQLCASACVRDE